MFRIYSGSGELKAEYPVRDLYDVIEIIRSPHGIFLFGAGKTSGSRIGDFLGGIWFAQQCLGAVLEPEFPPFRHFKYWVAARLGTPAGSRNWESLIVDTIGVDGSEAWTLCLDLMEEFRSDRPRHRLAQVDAERHYSRVFPNPEPVGPAPASVRVASYGNASLHVLEVTLRDGKRHDHEKDAMEACEKAAEWCHGISPEDWER